MKERCGMKTILVDLYGTLLQIPEFGPIETILQELELNTSHHELIQLCNQLGLFSKTVSSLSIWKSVMLSLGHSENEAHRANELWLSSSKQVKLFPQTTDFLLAMRQKGHKLVLASAVDRDSFHLLEKQFDFVKYFDEIMTTYKLGVSKSRLFYERICEEMILLPREAVMIGDNIEFDVLPANVIGMNTIFLSRYLLTDYEKDQLPPSTRVCATYDQVLDELNKL